jgi:hypothetical protein
VIRGGLSSWRWAINSQARRSTRTRRSRRAVCPEISLEYGALSGWDSAGWSRTKTSATKARHDGSTRRRAEASCHAGSAAERSVEGAVRRAPPRSPASPGWGTARVTCRERLADRRPPARDRAYAASRRGRRRRMARPFAPTSPIVCCDALLDTGRSWGLTPPEVEAACRWSLLPSSSDGLRAPRGRAGRRPRTRASNLSMDRGDRKQPSLGGAGTSSTRLAPLVPARRRASPAPRLHSMTCGREPLGEVVAAGVRSWLAPGVCGNTPAQRGRRAHRQLRVPNRDRPAAGRHCSAIRGSS